MTTLTERFPHPSDVDRPHEGLEAMGDRSGHGVAAMLADLRAEPPGGRLTVGDDRVVTFLVALARRLLTPAVARSHPELTSLGFFLRKAEIRRALNDLAGVAARVDPTGGSADPTDRPTTPTGRAAGPTRLRFPRGLVFHVPPANVDTIFVYSWALSALAGNPNVVRISSRSAGAADVVLDALNATLSDVDPEVAAAIAATQRMVTYGHDDAVTAALSAACELRVIWGGDASVREIRRHPLAPAARDLTFPDRSSFAVLNAAGWHAADTEARQRCVAGLYNDAYWFDQAACSSPRALFWVGEEPAVARAQHDLETLFAEFVAQRNPAIDAAMAVEKRVATYGLAADGAATAIRFAGNAVATADLTAPESLPRRWLGAGTFPQARVASLTDLASLVTRQDQTVTHFGFTAADLTDFARTLAGRGVDRVVPIGDALAFSAVWDGYDLLREFTRLTTIS